MGSTGVCWDNAVAETFFATLKKELVYRRTWPTRRELETEIFEYIEGFYNRQRRHDPRDALPGRLRGSNSVLIHFTDQKSINNNSGT
jgi:transposase InsO family protein